MKKIAFVSHSYHKKTCSINIYADEIFNKENFSVDYFYVDDWMLDPVGLSHPISGYDVVFIAQLISLELIKQIKCDNIIFLPMYDFSNFWTILKWLECINLKILSFTKSMHDQLIAMGFNSYYAKYYPEPFEFIPGDQNIIYLWQRINEINIQSTLKLLENFKIDQIHLHKAVDPYHIFVEPSDEEKVKYHITFSDWFSNKQDYLDILKKAGIYVAPRIMEGGASAFIDAMKMGKIVIANNNVSMNEYITHNVNGFLYDIHHIQPIDIDSIDLSRIQINAYQSVKDGHRAWRQSIPAILNFIESKNKFIISNQLIKTIKSTRESIQKDQFALTQAEQTIMKLNLDQLVLMQKFEKIEMDLKKENQELKQQLAYIENILENDRWYLFGKLSFKNKFKKAMQILFKKFLLILTFRKLSNE